MDSFYENWTVYHTRESIESDLASQLPVDKEFDGMPWCKKVPASAEANDTKWVWGTPDDGLMILIAELWPSRNSRVVIVTGVTAGKNATGCAH
jgi:hypothetical protein